MSRHWLRVWGPAVLQMVVIFGFSSIPNLTRLPGDISDKTGHSIGYAMLGGLVLRAMAGGRWSGVRVGVAALAWVFSAAYGATDEWHQHFVPGRTMAFDDWEADARGAAAAVVVGLLLASFINRRRFTSEPSGGTKTRAV